MTIEAIPSPINNQLHPVILKLLERRGVTGPKLKDFFSMDLTAIFELTKLIDLEKASQRIIKAMEINESIGIYGDYDVDGTTSCAVFYHFFKLINYPVKLVQPSRFIEGYGIHPPAIQTAKDEGLTLLITVDCGITNNEAAELAKEIGLDLIITDHHSDINEVMPNAYAIINPNRRDEPQDSPLRKVAGCGVAFATCLQVRQDLLAQNKECPSLYPLLQFVAIGTICDLVPLNYLNLRLVRHGLKQIPETKFPGIRAFFTPEERKYPVKSEKLGFHIGPLINSKGRLDHPEIALKLLTCDNSEEAFSYYSQLEHCNNERKLITALNYQKAEEILKRNEDLDSLTCAIVYDPEFHEGVVGIVASRLVDTFKIPAIVLTNTEEAGIIKGSARSAGDLNLFNLLEKQKHLFIKFGGHKAAAGLSMKKENLSDLQNALHQSLKNIPHIERTVLDSFDLELRPTDITPKLLRDLDLIGPFGPMNEMPIFKLKDLILESYDILKDKHVRWSFTDVSKKVKLKGISFNNIGKWGHHHPKDLFDHSKRNNPLSAYFTLGINRFNGNEYIQLMVSKVDFGNI